MIRSGFALVLFLTMAACTAGGLAPLPDGPFAPGVDPRGQTVDQLLVGHRLMAAGEYEPALQAFQRAALQRGLDGEVLTGLGSANLGLGRLNQAEDQLRRAVQSEPDWPEAWNNLGVVLMESGQTAEAERVFRRAFALSDGDSDAIRDNLRIALAKIDDPLYDAPEQQDFKLVRRGSGSYVIRQTP